MTSCGEVAGKASASGGRVARTFGVGICIAVAAALVSPRTIPYTMAALAAALIAVAAIQHEFDVFRPALGWVEFAIFGFIAYSAVSAAWAFRPSGAVVPVITAALCFTGYLIAAKAISSGCRLTAQRMAEGLWLGLFIGVIYLGIEIFTHQAIKLALLRELHIPKSWLRPPKNYIWSNGQLVGVAAVDLTRNIAPISLLFWPALLALRRTAEKRAVPILSALLIICVAVVVVASEHETSKVALPFSALIFVISRMNASRSGRLLQIAWIAACLVVIPCTMALHRLDLQHSPWFQMSFRHRIVIWNHTAEETLKSPIFGIGAGMMYQLDPAGEKQLPEDPFPSVAPHAHNVYLQTWFELGAIGAALLALVGLAILERIRFLDDRHGPYAQATFASVMVMISSSYGMWQPWFMAMVAMCALMITIAILIQEDRNGDEKLRQRRHPKVRFRVRG
jgi:hypothetical protein